MVTHKFRFFNALRESAYMDGAGYLMNAISSRTVKRAAVTFSSEVLNKGDFGRRPGKLKYYVFPTLGDV